MDGGTFQLSCLSLAGIMHQVVRYAFEPHFGGRILPEKTSGTTPKPSKPPRIWSEIRCLREEGPAQKSTLGQPGSGVGELDWSFGNGVHPEALLYQAQTRICAEAGACETREEVNGSRNAPTKISPCASVHSHAKISISHAFAQLLRAAPGSGPHRSWISCAASPQSARL